jgi:hypothetical protein
MKKTGIYLAIVIALALNVLSAQEQVKRKKDVWVDIGAGGGLSYLSNSLKIYKTSLNYTFNDNLYVGLSGHVGLSPNGTSLPNEITSSFSGEICVGVRSCIGKNLYLTPSLGLGTQAISRTGFEPEETLSISGLFSDNPSINAKKVYSVESFTTIAVPANLTLMYAGRYVGVSLNFYILASKYTEIGSGLFLSFGKIHAKT